MFYINYLITARKGFTVKFWNDLDEIFALWTEPLGDVYKSKLSTQSLKLYSKARANKAIKLFIIWLRMVKAR